MQPITWYLALFVSIPQIIIVILLGFSLFNLKVDYYRSIIVGLIMGLVSYLIRLLSIPLSLSTVFIIISIAILTWLICEKNFIDSLLAALLGVMLYGVLENLVLQLVFIITSYTIADVLTNPLLNIILFIPTLLLVVGIYLLVKKFNIIIYDLDLKEKVSEER